MPPELSKTVFAALIFLVSITACSSRPPHPPAPETATQPVAAQVEPSSPNPPAATPEAGDAKIDDAILDEVNIFFSPGSSTVRRIDKEKLRRHAQRLKEDRQLDVTLVGHTDGSGSRAFNLAIADMRVSSVGKLLKSFGVAAHQIRRNISGRHWPSTGCKTVACSQKMRRVELIYSVR